MDNGSEWKLIPKTSGTASIGMLCSALVTQCEILAPMRVLLLMSRGTGFHPLSLKQDIAKIEVSSETDEEKD